jgi:hypothetical protein
MCTYVRVSVLSIGRSVECELMIYQVEACLIYTQRCMVDMVVPSFEAIIAVY